MAADVIVRHSASPPSDSTITTPHWPFGKSNSLPLFFQPTLIDNIYETNHLEIFIIPPLIMENFE